MKKQGRRNVSPVSFLAGSKNPLPLGMGSVKLRIHGCYYGEFCLKEEDKKNKKRACFLKQSVLS